METTYKVFCSIIAIGVICFLGVIFYPLFQIFPFVIFIFLAFGAIVCLNILKNIIEKNELEQQKWKLKKEKARIEAERKADYESKKAERQLQFLQQKEELLRIKKELRSERAKLNQERNAFRNYPNSDFYDNQYW